MRVGVNGACIEVEVSEDVDKPAILLWNGAGCTLQMWDQASLHLKNL